MATIIIMFLIGYYFLTTNAPIRKPVVYNQLLTDPMYYSNSNIPDWHKIDAGPFYIETPKDFKLYILRGIDSYIGGITNHFDTIEFDYGGYSNSLDNCTSKDFVILTEIINGNKIKIVKKIGGQGYTAAYTAKRKSDNKLWIGCLDCVEQNEVIKMFKTIEFK